MKKIVLFSGLFLSFPVFALVVKLSEAQLTQKAIMIIEGTTAFKEMKQIDNSHGDIVTLCKIKIVKVDKRNDPYTYAPGDTITVLHLGGQVGKLRMTVSDSSSCIDGETAKYYLRESKILSGVFETVGMNQGKKKIVN